MSKFFDFDDENADGSDEKFFGGLKNRNLTDLFQKDKYEDDSNVTLKYQPVKQNLSSNSKNDTPTGKKHHHQQQISNKMDAANAMSKWTCIIAHAVKCHKNGVLEKKVGAAIIQNEEGTFKFIIYRSRTDLLGSMDLKNIQLRKIHDYLQFFDENGAYWSVRFLLDTDEKEFIDKLKEYGVQIKYEHGAGVGASTSSIEQHQKHKQKQKSEINDELVSLTVTSEDENKIKHSRNSLLNRVAKVGRALPKLHAHTSVTSVDSSNDEKESEELLYILNNKSTRASKSTTHCKIPVINSSTPFENEAVKILITESRNQNSDLRFKLRKLENRVEKILDKIEILNISSATAKTRERDDEIIELEEKILTLKKENRKFKQIINDNNEISHENCTDGIYKNFKETFESLGIYETYDMNTLIEILIEKIRNVEESRPIDVETDETYKLLQQCNDKLEIERENYINCKEKLQKLEETTKELEKTVEAVKEINQTLEEELIFKTIQVEETEKATVNAVKDIMNNLFTELTTKIEIEDLRKETVLAVIARTIREETVNAIEKLEKSHSTDANR